MGWGVAALAIWSPYLIWQATHGWPQLTISAEIRAEYSVVGERIGFAVLQLVLFGIAAMVFWIVGLVSLLRVPAWRPYRILVWIWLVTLVVFVVTAGQGYYTAGTYPALIAAGAVMFERWTHRRALTVVVVAAVTLVMMPPFIPVVPVKILVANPMWSGLAENQLETVGWPELVDQVAAAYAAVPVADRGSVTILTDNYGEAGAVDRYGPAQGLSTAYSGHNAFGLWGPPPAEKTTVVAVSEDGAPTQLSDCVFFTRVHNDARIDNEESTRAAIYVCRAPAQGWAAAWPRIVHLDN